MNLLRFRIRAKADVPDGLEVVVAVPELPWLHWFGWAEQRSGADESERHGFLPTRFVRRGDDGP